MSKKIVGALLLLLFGFSLPRFLMHGTYLAIIVGLSIALAHAYSVPVQVLCR